MKGKELENRVIQAMEIITGKQGITTVEIIKQLGIGDPTKPKAASYRLAKVKMKLGRWLFVQKDGKLTRWFSREYARKNNVVDHVKQDKNKNYGDPDALHTAQTIRLMNMLNRYMTAGRAQPRSEFWGTFKTTMERIMTTPDNVIKETIFGGWKGSAVFSAISLVFAVIEFFDGNGAASGAFIIASCGWIGWSIQEREHLSGKVIGKS